MEARPALFSFLGIYILYGPRFEMGFVLSKFNFFFFMFSCCFDLDMLILKIILFSCIFKKKNILNRNCYHSFFC